MQIMGPSGSTLDANQHACLNDELFNSILSKAVCQVLVSSLKWRAAADIAVIRLDVSKTHSNLGISPTLI